MKNIINVSFCTYEPYESMPNNDWPLCDVSLATAARIIHRLKINIVPPHSCIDTISAKLGGFHTITNLRELNFHDDAIGYLEISNLWYSERPTLKCMSSHAHPKYDNAVKRCAENLAAGKCVDKCMRHVLGSVIFPQHYAKQKQK